MAVAKRVLLLASKDIIGYSCGPGREAVADGAGLLRSVPAELITADVTVQDVSAEPSWDMSPATMLTLARRARSAILQDGFDGVVLAHGTDTMEDTAFLTDLMAGPAATRGGIVLTGAMRCLDAVSADGPGNLAAAIAAAADPALRGVGVVLCLNDELHAARWVTKVDATSVAAFSSAPFGVLGRVTGGSVELVGVAPPRPPPGHGELESDVALIRTYPGIDGALLTAVVDAGARGIVLEGTGAGNVPAGLFAAISDLTQWDIPVVVASRCRTRPVELGQLGCGAGLSGGVGAIGAPGLPAGKARSALMAALGGGGRDAVRRWFSEL